MRKIIAAFGLLVGLFVVVSIVWGVTASYNRTIRIVDSAGTVINGVASATTGLYSETVRVVDSAGNVIDNFASGSGGTITNANVNGVINVTNPAYGAVCDGITDDTVAIQAAITAATALHREVFFPTGQCLVTTITWPADVIFRGAGIDTTSSNGPHTGAGSFLIGTTGDNVIDIPATAKGGPHTMIDMGISGGLSGIFMDDGNDKLQLVRVLIYHPTTACVQFQGELDQFYAQHFDCVGGQYGLYQNDAVGVPSGAAARYDKWDIQDTQFRDQTINGIHLDVSLMNSDLFTNVFVTGSGQDGVYINGTGRQLVWVNYNAEGNGSTGKANITTGSITSGAACLTVANVTGYAQNDTVTVTGAGAFGKDLSSNADAVGTCSGANSITLHDNASITVASARVTNAVYDDFLVANSHGTTSNLTFVGGVSSGTGGGGKVKYAADFTSLGSQNSVIGMQANANVPFYDPNNKVDFRDSLGEVRRGLNVMAAGGNSPTNPSQYTSAPQWARYFGDGNEGAGTGTGTLSGEHWYTTWDCTGAVSAGGRASLTIRATQTILLEAACALNFNAVGTAVSGFIGGSGGGSGGGAAGGSGGSNTGYWLAKNTLDSLLPGGGAGLSSGGNGSMGNSVTGSAANVGIYNAVISGGWPNVARAATNCGGGSGAAGANSGGAAGTSGSCVILIAPQIIIVPGATINVDGGDGGSAVANSTGAGSGGGGGFVALAAYNYVGTLIATANGGSGGNVTNPAIILHGGFSPLNSAVTATTGAYAHVGTFVGGNPTAITVDVAGTGYTSAPTCTVVGNGGGANTGSGATCSCTINGGGVNACTITGGNGGYGTGTSYTTAGLGGFGGNGGIYQFTIQ